MKCPSCGENNPDELKFCGECGAKLSAPKPVKTPEPVKTEAKVEDKRSKKKVSMLIMSGILDVAVGILGTILAAIMLLVPNTYFNFFWGWYDWHLQRMLFDVLLTTSILSLSAGMLAIVMRRTSIGYIGAIACLVVGTLGLGWFAVGGIIGVVAVILVGLSEQKQP